MHSCARTGRKTWAACAHALVTARPKCQLCIYRSCVWRSTRVLPINFDTAHLSSLVVQTAATALHMGMSVFKKVARSVGISRWPFRKRQSVREIMEMIDKHLVGHLDPNPAQA